MKIKFPAILIAFAGAASVLWAGITGSNLLPVATYSAGAITNTPDAPPQTHAINPQTFTFYHSATNAAFQTTNYAQVTFDGGQTWATYAVFIYGTNSQSETWTPSTATLTASNRILTVNGTNQTLYHQANWLQ